MSSRNPRRRFTRGSLAVAATAAALALTPVVAGTAAAATVHPLITDPAGDARNQFGTNIAAVDLLTGDVTVQGPNLVLTVHVADLSSADKLHSYGYNLDLGWAGNSHGIGSTTRNGSATFTTYQDGAGGPDFSATVNGTSTFDLAASTVTMTFPLAPITANTTDLGPAPLQVGTAIDRAVATANRSGSIFDPTAAATDNGSTTSGFILGQ